MIVQQLPYEIVFNDGTYVVVTDLKADKIVYAYTRKYGELPDGKRIIDYYNVPWHYHSINE